MATETKEQQELAITTAGKNDSQFEERDEMETRQRMRCVHPR